MVIDLETTGLNPEEDEIIEFGAMKMIGHERTDTFNAIIMCEKSVPVSISRLTGIDNQMLRETGEPLNEVLIHFSEFVGDLPIVGHNIDFDRSFLLCSCAKCGCPAIVNRYVDTLSLARRLIKGVENYKLETLVARFGIESNGTHRSIRDCDLTALLYKKLINMIDADSKDTAI